MASELHLRVVTPDQVIVDRKVRSVKFTGIDGSYGILPHHAPLMTAIGPAGMLAFVELDGSVLEMFVSDGFAQMQHNVLTLACQAGELVDEIDMERALQKEKDAREKLTHLDKLSEDFLKAEISLKKAMVRERLVRRRSGTGGMR